jgi:UDP-N-acetylmuramoyl-L-alanyl-D-glutamate--2,6-diaminopimelate ligase
VRLDALVDATHDVAITVVGDPEAVTVTGVVHDTRDVVPGALYCCIRGSRVDGHDLAPAAIEAGAVALLCDHELELPVPQLVVKDVRAALGPVAAAFYGNPSRQLHVVGVTGTNGKTTTTHILARILEAHGWPTGIIGTISGARTTPEAPALQALLAGERTAGHRAVAMEVSSQALAVGRVRATRFEVAIFTNLGRDHLETHPTVEDYFEAKALLFGPDYADAAVVNLDDEHGRILAERGLVPTVGFSLADARDLELSRDGSWFTWRGQPIELTLPGRFNVANALAAATAADLLGVDHPTIARALAAMPAVEGRFERVDGGQPFFVAIDYAHNADALEQALLAAREVADGARVLVVFGCGGERDIEKRPLMGEVAARLADRVVLTSDNPRGEDPLAIIDAIRAGAAGAPALSIEPDRRAAIASVIAEAAPGDVVMIVGKGHEKVQIIGDRELAFDDHAVALEALATLEDPW